MSPVLKPEPANMEGERPWRGCGGLGVTLNTDKIGFFLIKQTDTHALFEVQLWGHLKKGNHRRVGLWRKSLTPGSAPLSFLKEAKECPNGRAIIAYN